MAYVDTSCLVAIALGETGATALGRRLDRFDALLASNLLEAELRTALARERVTDAPHFLSGLTWILPDRPLSLEMARVLSVGTLKGADLWHLACALYLPEEPSDLHFVTLVRRQAEVAQRLGFQK